jgi:Carboxypeptidase regulatory-like domain
MNPHLSRLYGWLGLLIICGIPLTGCDGSNVQSQNSGIEGQVSYGPISPIARPGVNNSRPYQATVTVLDQNGQTVTQFQSNADGTFRVSLKPGRYTLRPEAPGTYPHAAQQVVTVSAGKFTQVRIYYDSGIR